MALKFIVNQSWENATTLVATDAAHANQVEGNSLMNLRAGARYNRWTQVNATTDRVVYVNTTGGLSANTVILSDVRSLHNLSHDLDIVYYDAWFGTQVSIASFVNYNETLIGPDSQDYVLEFTQLTDKQGFGVVISDGAGGAFTRVLGKMYFGNAFSLCYAPASTSLRIEKASRTERIFLENNGYKVFDRVFMSFIGVTAAEFNTFNNLFRLYTQPFFLYDDSGTASEGDFLPYKLLHVICPNAPVIKSFEGLYGVNFELFTLRPIT